MPRCGEKTEKNKLCRETAKNEKRRKNKLFRETAKNEEKTSFAEIRRETKKKTSFAEIRRKNLKKQALPGNGEKRRKNKLCREMAKNGE